MSGAAYQWGLGGVGRLALKMSDERTGKLWGISHDDPLHSVSNKLLRVMSPSSLNHLAGAVSFVGESRRGGGSVKRSSPLACQDAAADDPVKTALRRLRLA